MEEFVIHTCAPLFLMILMFLATVLMAGMVIQKLETIKLNIWIKKKLLKN